MSDAVPNGFHTCTVSGISQNGIRRRGNSSSEKVRNFRKATWPESGKGESVT